VLCIQVLSVGVRADYRDAADMKSTVRYCYAAMVQLGEISEAEAQPVMRMRTKRFTSGIRIDIPFRVVNARG